MKPKENHFSIVFQSHLKRLGKNKKLWEKDPVLNNDNYGSNVKQQMKNQGRVRVARVLVCDAIEACEVMQNQITTKGVLA